MSSLQRLLTLSSQIRDELESLSVNYDVDELADAFSEFEELAEEMAITIDGMDSD